MDRRGRRSLQVGTECIGIAAKVIKAFWFFFLKKNVFHGQTNLINQNLNAPLRQTKKESLLQALNIFSISQKYSLVNPQFYSWGKVLPIVQKPPENFKHYANCISPKTVI